MRRAPLVLPAVLACALLLTACGSRGADAQSHGLPPGQVSASTGASGGSSCGGVAPPGSPAPGGDTSGVRLDEAEVVSLAGCPAFAVTNDEPEPYTYTVTFQLMSAADEAMGGSKQTMASVGPGRTVKAAVEPVELPAGLESPVHVKIIVVRGVPTAEAPSAAGPCPASGVHVYAGATDGAMGLRVVGLVLTNCGTRAYRLDGIPDLQLLDDRHEPVDGVKILHSGDTLAAGTGSDAGPRALVLQPGQSAHADLVWRNTTLAGEPVANVPYARVVAKPGAAPVMVTPELDLGSTGQLAVGTWEKATRGTP